MAVLNIIKAGDPVLKATAKPVTKVNKHIKKLLDDMAETMYAAPGIGLAAPQVGKSLRLIVIDISDEKNQLLALVNPTITASTDTLIEGEEGCLSLPDLTEKIKRPSKVHVDAFDLQGNSISMDCEGLLAVCVQHEVDHLNGHVFIDHLSLLKKNRAIEKLAKLRREKAREKKHRAN